MLVAEKEFTSNHVQEITVKENPKITPELEPSESVIRVTLKNLLPHQIHRVQELLDETLRIQGIMDSAAQDAGGIEWEIQGKMPGHPPKFVPLAKPSRTISLFDESKDNLSK